MFSSQNTYFCFFIDRGNRHGSFTSFLFLLGNGSGLTHGLNLKTNNLLQMPLTFLFAQYVFYDLIKTCSTLFLQLFCFKFLKI